MWLNNTVNTCKIAAKIISVVAIFISIDATKKQNQKALFDKRYEVYQQITLMENFIDSYYLTKDNVEHNGIAAQEDYYRSLWEGEVRPYSYESSDVNNVIK